MLDFFSQAALLSLLLLALAYVRLARAISYSGGVPRVGSPGVLGYIQTALKWTIHAEDVIKEGRQQFFGKPFVIPTLVSLFVLKIKMSLTATQSGPYFFLSPEYLGRVRAGPDSVVRRDQISE